MYSKNKCKVILKKRDNIIFVVAVTHNTEKQTSRKVAQQVSKKSFEKSVDKKD